MQQSNDKYQTGKLGEDLTAYFLEKHGYTIVKRNYRVKGGEIDIIATKGDIIAFVEVKTRDASALDSGVNAVNKSKRKLIIKTAQEYSYRNEHDYQPRFDIAEVLVKNGKPIKFNYIDNAFDGGSDFAL